MEIARSESTVIARSAGQPAEPASKMQDVRGNAPEATTPGR
jgi:hypothetical protein